jgi:hypothetical protein
MIELLNEIIQDTPHGEIDLSIIRSHVNPKFIRAWEVELGSPDFYKVSITDSKITIDATLCVVCSDGQEAEAFLLYLLASRSVTRGAKLNQTI